MKLVWCTDVHLDHASPAALASAVDGLGDGLLLTGDLSNARQIVPHLMELSERIDGPIWFILGNHDYYGGSFAEVRAAVSHLRQPNLTWLHGTWVELSPGVALVGHEGWYDGLSGRPGKSPVMLNDWRLIHELQQAFDVHDWLAGRRSGLLTVLRRLAEQAVAEAIPALEAALADHAKVIFATHVPPFVEATWHEGQVSNGDWLPWFSSSLMGAALRRVAARWPQRQIVVLCGHTHGEGVYEAADNLIVLTGRAEYGHPQVSEVLEV